MGHNELLLGRAIQGRRDQVLLSVKFGAMRAPNGAFVGVDTRPAAVKNFLSYTLRRLNVDYIDIYRPARVDPHVPTEDTIGAIAEMVKAGYVRHIALSEAGPDTIRRANVVHPIVDVQLEYSLVSRSIESKILPVLGELGIAVTAYGVLSRGLLTSSKVGGPGDFRAHLPRFARENLANNQKLVEALRSIAAEHQATPVQLATAWVLAQGSHIVPLLGSRSREQLGDVLGALDLKLSADELRRIAEAVPASQVAGTRYDDGQMRMLDSERPAKAAS
jgi:aryl-alcohol dehydrogenase-like predicted oxidoreductase